MFKSAQIWQIKYLNIDTNIYFCLNVWSDTTTIVTQATLSMKCYIFVLVNNFITLFNLLYERLASKDTWFSYTTNKLDHKIILIFSSQCFLFVSYATPLECARSNNKIKSVIMTKK